MDKFTDCRGIAFSVHEKSVCEGDFCAIHNPSDHHMVDWPMLMREDKMYLIERMCKHGVGHSDPDSVKAFEAHGIGGMGIHGCDGCCASPKKYKTLFEEDNNA